MFLTQLAGMMSAYFSAAKRDTYEEAVGQKSTSGLLLQNWCATVRKAQDWKRKLGG